MAPAPKEGSPPIMVLDLSISTETGKVLDYAVESKVCNACNIQQKNVR